ncbi:pyruvate dehydrogenase (acetyl-transferring) E1 component subunit alpha [Curtobacterium sp. C1]|uniref:2-oxoisovalerate dehydrogenase subunit alpha n=2 Tax=Curtobacterium TaxID=2034 RepID=A0A850DT04_9MICO|nr:MULTISPECIES: thiamine pyrophosphate-dependent enzyme [Curtobacterium]MDK8171810.1 thiamine pyrophosphate-dependent enzyme [Curtobacterium citreum]NUU27280.1 pyruvate dehydrogenase (acetyl-transferring) E1 component subunit alpha [Curtobacterium albidum]QKS17723.1 pyruvate dehydrogenase (acetyl-transferring) E1 component subunit alpha [Curtobacterium sp. Csp2]UFU14406.1 pyruvate dehydrogenase (acetyl-transferring) E1 component subunit alpha [Curtobacterium sp. C1]WIJ45739.1 thiamine pyropho
MSFRAAAPESTTVRLLDPEGRFVETDENAEYAAAARAIPQETLLAMHRRMVLTRRFDHAGHNLQRTGQLGLWVPSHGQEAAQVGSVFALRAQDHVFPSYREHAVTMHRGVEPMEIIAMYRGQTHGGWDPDERGNTHISTLVIGSQTLHATGYALGQQLDGVVGTGDPDVDSCSIVYFGDGATSQGDVNEAYVFAASTKAPVVFFLQNNHWAISVPVTTQSPSPLVDRPRGFGIPSVRVDGNDVLASYTASVVATDHARSGQGPAFVEADTYRIGAHTSSDDPSRYREDDELAEWVRRDPISRSAAYLRSLGVTDAQLAVFDEEGEDIAADVRRRTVALAPPSIDVMFQNVYREPHPTVADQQAWLERYEAGYEGGSH